METAFPKLKRRGNCRGWGGGVRWGKRMTNREDSVAGSYETLTLRRRLSPQRVMSMGTSSRKNRTTPSVWKNEPNPMYVRKLNCKGTTTTTTQQQQ